MIHRIGYRYCLGIVTLSLFISTSCFAEMRDYPCNSPGALELTDRGTVTDTPCIVPTNKVLIEGGYQYQWLESSTQLQVYPQTIVVLGLPNKFEVFLGVPTYYNKQSNLQARGLGITTAGVKHEVTSGSNWVASIQGILTIPSGSRVFGSPKTGETINAILVRELTPKIVFASMFGGSRIAESSNNGGRYFTSFNPSISLVYAPTDPLNLFIEVFGQSKTAPDLGSGFIANGGLLYKFKENVIFDLEIGQRIQGNLFDIQQSIGSGVTILVS